MEAKGQSDKYHPSIVNDEIPNIPNLMFKLIKITHKWIAKIVSRQVKVKM